MPELPEVEVIAGELTQLIGGVLLDALVSGKRLRGNLAFERTDGGMEVLKEQVLRAIGRRGRYLILEFSSSLACLVHLGMSGRLALHKATSTKNTPLTKHEHIRLVFSNGVLSYFDPRRFGAWELVYNHNQDAIAHPWLQALGAEPVAAAQFDALSPKVRHFEVPLDPNRLLHFSQKHPKLTLKECLMDNRLVTGIGNIYANELLFKAAWHPKQLARYLTLNDWQRLATLIGPLMLQAVHRGGSTIRDYRHSDGNSGGYQKLFKVYGRAGQKCYNCSTILQNTVIKGRSSVYCPVCQQLHEDT